VFVSDMQVFAVNTS